MMRAAILAAALCVASTVAYAQAWRPIELQCADTIQRQLHCASCGGSWPLYTLCTVQRVYGDQIPPARLKACMQKIWDRRWEEKTCALCGPDPVAELIRCAGGE